MQEIKAAKPVGAAVLDACIESEVHLNIHRIRAQILSVEMTIGFITTVLLGRERMVNYCTHPASKYGNI